VDVSQGVGGDLAHYAQGSPQADGAQPLLPLGAQGRLELGGPPQAWQVVGYVERCEIPDDPEDERIFWREYLLYARDVGFAFLVDAEDGWSWAVPITGAPQVRGDTAAWGGTTYRKLYSYTGQITYVLGEFYWKLDRGQRTFNTDYAAGIQRLNREQAGDEVTWSEGRTMDAGTVAAAFNLPADRHAALQRDVLPISATPAGAMMTKSLLVVIVVVILLVILIKDCSNDDCDEMRQTFGESSREYQQCLRSGGGGGRVGGGSFGGFGTGGGHK
jgi:Domain of unknown function (DUF4178)